MAHETESIAISSASEADEDSGLNGTLVEAKSHRTLAKPLDHNEKHKSQQNINKTKSIYGQINDLEEIADRFSNLTGSIFERTVKRKRDSELHRTESLGPDTKRARKTQTTDPTVFYAQQVDVTAYALSSLCTTYIWIADRAEWLSTDGIGFKPSEMLDITNPSKYRAENLDRSLAISVKFMECRNDIMVPRALRLEYIGGYDDGGCDEGEWSARRSYEGSCYKCIEWIDEEKLLVLVNGGSVKMDVLDIYNREEATVAK